MAEVVVDVKVNAPDTSALSAIKKELKEMKSLALNGDGVAAKRVAELTDKLEDLKDETKSLKGSGVEKLTGSFNLLTEGFRNADVEKLKIGFKGLGNAMSAIPLFFLIEGLKWIVDNFDKIVDGFKEFFDITSDGAKEVKALNKELENTKRINQSMEASISNEIRLMEAQGKSQAQILAKRKELNALKIKELEIDIELNKSKIKEIFLNDSIIESLTRKAAQIQRAAGNDVAADAIEKGIFQDKLKRSKEQADAITKDAIAIANLKTDIQVAEIKTNQEGFKKAEEIRAKNKEAADKELSDYNARMAYIAKQKEQQREKDIEKLNEERAEDLDSMSAYLEADLKIKADKKKAEEEMDKAAEAEKKLRAEREFQIEKNSLSAAQGLTEAFFAYKLSLAEGDEAAQLEIKKKAFNVDKAFRVAQATMDTIGAVSKTLAAGGALAIPLAVSIGLLGAANVAKILATKFNAGSAGGGSGVGTIKAPTVNGGGSQQPTTNQLPQQPQQSTTFDEQGNKNGGTNWISVKEINATQRRVNRVTEQARF